MIDRLINFFKKSAADTKGKAPEGVCPNCWGNQKYDNVVREMYVDKQIDVNNHEANHAFIKDFVVTNISGITLRKGTSGFECPTCKIVYPDDK